MDSSGDSLYRGRKTKQRLVHSPLNHTYPSDVLLHGSSVIPLCRGPHLPQFRARRFVAGWLQDGREALQLDARPLFSLSLSLSSALTRRCTRGEWLRSDLSCGEGGSLLMIWSRRERKTRRRLLPNNPLFSSLGFSLLFDLPGSSVDSYLLSGRPSRLNFWCTLRQTPPLRWCVLLPPSAETLFSGDLLVCLSCRVYFTDFVPPLS